MPLPEGGAVPWPPEHCGPINAQYATWAAWYSGDVDQLAAIYGGGASADTTGFFASETGGFRSAVNRTVAAVRRWFWGSRSNRAKERQRLHVPIASDIASASSDLLFSELPSITVPAPAQPAAPDGTVPPAAAPSPTQEYLDQLLQQGTHATLLEAAEICAALGGVYLRIVWDPTVRDRPWLTAVHPDAGVPEWRWGDLAAVTFWKVIASKGKTVVRHLERHEPGKILHGVYEGTCDELGHVVPLTEYPATAGLANEQLIDGNTIPTGATGLTVAYVPNMRPNRLWRNQPEAAHLGRSDFAGVESLMDALDLTYSSLIRDVDLGRARLIMPREYLQAHGPGQGASLDLDQELYEPINLIAPEDGSTQITQVQFAIRVDEHDKVIEGLKTTIVTSAGYSAQTFGLTGEVAVTATEVAAKERRSYITRDRKTGYWQPELADILLAYLEVAAYWFKPAGVVAVRPDVEWADSVSIDPVALAQELNLLEQAKAISTDQKVRRLNPTWGDTEVAAEVQKITDETAAPVPDPTTFTGGGGFDNPPGGPPQE
jgi:hypothetical protein